jgi:hypothetical protein
MLVLAFALAYAQPHHRASIQVTDIIGAWIKINIHWPHLKITQQLAISVWNSCRRIVVCKRAFGNVVVFAVVKTRIRIYSALNPRLPSCHSTQFHHRASIQVTDIFGAWIQINIHWLRLQQLAISVWNSCRRIIVYKTVFGNVMVFAVVKIRISIVLMSIQRAILYF